MGYVGIGVLGDGRTQNYHYQSFGVPGLGLKRGLGKDLVISPYATALAAIVDPPAAVANFDADRQGERRGPVGLLRRRRLHARACAARGTHVVIRSYMAHHQGMVLVALANCLLRPFMPRRFHAEPLVRATELLLQERLPMSASVPAARRRGARPVGRSPRRRAPSAGEFRRQRRMCRGPICFRTGTTW